MSWKVAGAHVVSEKIEEEVIVVDLLDGSYYSITGSGIAIWEHIRNGLTRDQILQTLSAALDGAPQDLGRHFDEFIAALLGDKLIELQTAQDSPATTTPATGERIAFAPPAVTKFTDMEDVLKMDPIHDFDELGWPNKSKT